MFLPILIMSAFQFFKKCLDDLAAFLGLLLIDQMIAAQQDDFTVPHFLGVGVEHRFTHLCECIKLLLKSFIILVGISERRPILMVLLQQCTEPQEKLSELFFCLEAPACTDVEFRNVIGHNTVPCRLTVLRKQTGF